MRAPLPPPRCIAIDVDGTLITDGRVNQPLVDYARGAAEAGFDILIWSMRGRIHAERAMQAAGLTDVARAISKPGLIIDDQGLTWLRHVRITNRVPRVLSTV